MENLQMTATVDGRGKLTMEALAQAWDALTYTAGAPPEAVIQVNTSASAGRWIVTARWTPADVEPDETEAEDADRIELTVPEAYAQNVAEIAQQIRHLHI